MGTRNFQVLKNPVFDNNNNNIRQSLKNSTFHINMIGVVSSLCQSFWGYVFYLIGFVTRYLFRLLENEQKNYKSDRRFFHGGRGEEEEEEDKDCDNSETCSSISGNTKKYEVFTSKDINCYVVKPNPINFTVHEVFEAHEEEYWKNKFESFSKNHINNSYSLEQDSIIKTDDFVSEEREELEGSTRFRESSFDYNNSEAFVAKEKESSFDPNFDFVALKKEEKQKEELKESTHFQQSSFDSNNTEVFVAQEKEESTNFQESSFDRSSEDFVALENEEKGEEEVKESSDFEEDIESSIVFELFDNESEGEYIEIEPKRGESFTELREKEEKTEESEEWGHDDVIEQLKWELRSARNRGLPTILEEEESTTPPEDEATSLKEMRNIELKFGYKERMEEILKVYNIYAERMRKLDILNNQTMHALGLLQLKDQFKSTTPNQNFVPIKPQKQNDPSKTLKHGANLQNDFELVYVGHVCLSWEILHWQHRSVRDLLRNDNSQPCRRRFNFVASEFQLFQVLIQRFIEDESFRGPRVQNYVKNRCVIRSLMQVPVVRGDCVKEKKYVMEEENEDSVFVEILDKIIVEAMFTFGEFVRKDEKKMNSKVSQLNQIEASDTKLLMDIRKEFQKKERKVKDIQRSGNCVMRKLQKNQEQDRMFQHALLLAQVELRLVSRVLSMSRLTRDQLIWCQQKLNQISFANKQVHLETSFLLIPC